MVDSGLSLARISRVKRRGTVSSQVSRVDSPRNENRQFIARRQGAAGKPGGIDEQNFVALWRRCLYPLLPHWQGWGPGRPARRDDGNERNSGRTAQRSPLSALRSPLSALRSPLSALRSPLPPARSSQPVAEFVRIRATVVAEFVRIRAISGSMPPSWRRARAPQRAGCALGSTIARAEYAAKVVRAVCALRRSPIFLSVSS
jgi:hypothetical protein